MLSKKSIRRRQSKYRAAPRREAAQEVGTRQKLTGNGDPSAWRPDLTHRKGRLKRYRINVQIASQPSACRIFLPSVEERGMYAMGTSAIFSPIRQSFAVTSGQNSNRWHCRLI